MKRRRGEAPEPLRGPKIASLTHRFIDEDAQAESLCVCAPASLATASVWRAPLLERNNHLRLFPLHHQRAPRPLGLRANGELLDMILRCLDRRCAAADFFLLDVFGI